MFWFKIFDFAFEFLVFFFFSDFVTPLYLTRSHLGRFSTSHEETYNAGHVKW